MIKRPEKSPFFLPQRRTPKAKLSRPRAFVPRFEVRRSCRIMQSHWIVGARSIDNNSAAFVVWFIKHLYHIQKKGSATYYLLYVGRVIGQ